MELRSGYKHTEIGVIPEEWEVRLCSEVCIKIQDGTHFSPKIKGNDYLYVTSKHIGFGTFDVSSADRIDTVQHKAIYERCDVACGDFLFTKDGANTGNAAINNLTEEFSLLSSVAFLRFDKNKHIPEYFLQQILSESGQCRIKEAMTGNAITRLTLDKINKLRYAVPLLPEQRAIASALSDVDAMINSLVRLIAKKREMKQAAMQELLTGKRRLPGFGGKWDHKTVGEVVSFSGGSQPPRSTFVFQKTDGYIRLVQIRDYKTDEFETYIPESLAQKKCTAEDIMIGRYGPPIFQILRGIEGAYNVALIKATPLKGLEIEYLYQFLKQDSLFTYMDALSQRSSGQTGIEMPALKDYPFPYPTVPEQVAIATVLSDMDIDIATMEQKRNKTQQLKQGMMQELLTGKVRLI